MAVLLYSTTEISFETQTTAKTKEAERVRFAIHAAKEQLQRELARDKGEDVPRGKAMRARRRAKKLLSKIANDVPVAFDDDDDSYEEDSGGAPEKVDHDGFPILPINQMKMAASNGKSGPGAADVLPGLFAMSTQTRKIDETMLPYKCGVIVYDHHIPGEGGAAMNNWIKELVESNDGASFILSGENKSKESYIKKVKKNIQRIGPNNWMMINSHRNGLAFATDENTLLSWRDTVERQNCHFVTAAIFSDSLDHSIKHTKQRFAECDCTIAEFYDTISEVIENLVTYGPLMSNPWVGQLDHFLFKSDNAPSMETKDKVKMAMRVLKEHFDIVMVEGKDDFAEKLVKITGLSVANRIKNASISDKDGLVYAKDLISAFGKISSRNGDADFIDAINHVYYNSLAFLMMQ
ncbi:hypothetical protein ACHAW5_001287 [Stephanodiscus triporus]|uniref:Uncharacterized protein n=1 Tax=Stephanodiscus triporus TaxID=2934178 RepID=A0ABD3MZ95_9STRA